MKPWERISIEAIRPVGAARSENTKSAAIQQEATFLSAPTGRTPFDTHLTQGFAALHPGLFSAAPYGSNPATRFIRTPLRSGKILRMKPDIYTKIVLTVIASLLINSDFFAQDRKRPSLQAESQKVGMQILSHEYTACGAIYFGKSNERLIEFKGGRITVVPEKVSDADRLNGVEWKGLSRFNYSAFRWRENGVWTEWEDNRNGPCLENGSCGDDHYQAFIKKSGKWYITYAWNRSHSWKGVDDTPMPLDEYLKTLQAPECPNR